MPRYIGIDEAGLAPNLGPLVITVTLWESSQPLSSQDLWNVFEDVIAQDGTRDGTCLHIADSKLVHQSSQGVAALELGVLSAFRLARLPITRLTHLWDHLHTPEREEFHAEPWNVESDFDLPCAADPSHIDHHAQRWASRANDAGVELLAIRAAIILPAKLNALLRRHGSKGIVTSTLAFQLLREVWDPHSDDHVLIIGDKHGGRNRYDEFIQDIVGDEFIIRGQESMLISHYRVRNSQLRFQVGGEEHLPVAVASMVSKYVREVLLMPFNNFWCRHVPGLKPTKGYPQDARRFKQEINERQLALGISDDLLWRMK